MNEQHAIAITKRLMTDRTLQPIVIPIKFLYVTIVAVELAERNPNLGEVLRAQLRKIARLLKAAGSPFQPKILLAHLTLAQTEAVMKDEQRVNLMLEVRYVWLIISAFQLSLRHPELNESQIHMLTDLVRQYQTCIIALHPDANELIEAGYDPANDR